MTETTGTIIKLLSGLTSPKACVKYLTVACFLVISWKYLYDIINSTNIPKEQISIIILLIGVGTGSIVGHFIGFIGELGWKKYALLKEEKENKEKEKIKKEFAEKQKIQRNEELTRKFKIALSHLHWKQKEALRELTLKNKNLNLSQHEYAALVKNGYVQKIINVASSTFLVQINPLIKNIVAKKWKEEILENIEAFYQETYVEPLLKLMNLENKEDQQPINPAILNNLSEYSGCIKGKYDEKEKGYWLWFDDYFLQELENRNNTSYIDELFVPESRYTSKKDG